MNPSPALPRAFRVSRFILTLTPRAPLHLPAFHGATLRGGFGYAFRGAVCVIPRRECDACLLKSQCAYAVVFETSPPPGSTQLRNLTDIPRPFVLEPPLGDQRDFAPGDPLELGLILVGRALDYLPYFVYTFQQLGERGLGRDRVPFELTKVDFASADADRVTLYAADTGVLHPAPPPLTGAELSDAPKPSSSTAPEAPPRQPGTLPSPSTLTLRFLTPTHLRVGGRACREATFRTLMATLFRRLSSLCYFHCGVELELPFKELLQQAEQVAADPTSLRWAEQSRFSTRQRRRVHADGFVGEVTYTGPLAPYLPFLRAGELVHVGKGCVFGMGKYVMDVPVSRCFRAARVSKRVDR